jgi:outer membrane lipoprotein-sorting protein
MNKFFRSTSTGHLLSALLGGLATVAVGTTIAIAAIGTGPVPRRESLARAVHQGLSAPAVTGVFARITFTNNLIESGEVQGSDPLLTGGSGRLWWTGHHLRLEIQGDNGDAQVVVNGRSFWAYDPAFKTVYQGTLPAPNPTDTRAHNNQEALPTVARIQSALGRLARHLVFSGADPQDIAGQPAYSVRVSPRHDNGLLGTVQLAWDALHRAPLRVGLYARGNPTPVLGVSVSDISFGPQPPSVFAIAPPAGAKVVKVASSRRLAGRLDHGHSRTPRVAGLPAVARQLPFTLRAPEALAGRPRTSVRLLRLSDHPAALLSYGHGLGTILVLEQAAGRTRLIRAPSGDGPGLSLPTVALNGVTGQQLRTAIGTLVRFIRTGVTYTVLGSVPASVADAAARGL